MITTPEDTFRRLKREPLLSTMREVHSRHFESLCNMNLLKIHGSLEKFLTTMRNQGTHPRIKEIINPLGWTVEEYLLALWNRSLELHHD